MKNYIYSFLLFLGLVGIAVGAPAYTPMRTILPETTSTYELGTSTKSWLRGTFDNLVIKGSASSGDCLVTDSNGVVSTSACGTSSGGFTMTAVKTADYTANVNEYVPCDNTAGSFTITLPTAPADGSEIKINLINNIEGNRLIINAGGADVIGEPGGPTSINLYYKLEVRELQYHSGVWYNTAVASPTNFAAQFPGIDAKTPITNADISFATSTGVLTITPPLGYFNIVTDGNGYPNTYKKTGAVAFPAITDTTGMWYFYFNKAGTPTATQNPWLSSDFPSYALAYRVLWNASSIQKSVAEYIEYHLNTISASDHAADHANGSYWQSGLTMSNNTLSSGTPNADGRNAVIALSTGTVVDDNLPYTVTNSMLTTPWNQDMGSTTAVSLTALTGGKFQIFTQNGTGEISFLPATRFPFSWNSGTNLPQYISSVGVPTGVGGGNFFVYFVYSTQNPRTGEAIKVVSATSDFGTLANAQAYQWSNIQSVYPDIIGADNEIRPLYKLIYLYNTGYNVGTKKSVLRQVDDIRKTVVSQTAASGGSINATSVILTPFDSIISTNVQSAIQEMQTLAKGNFVVGSDEGWKQATTSMFMSSTGNVGIGTTTPSKKLSVSIGNSGNLSNGLLVERGLGGYNGAQYGLKSDASGAYRGAISVFNAANSEVEAMSFLTTGANAGYVGIGTTTPIGKLQIAGDITSASAQLFITGSTNSNQRMSIGYDTTSDYGYIQPLIQGTAYKNLILNQSGGNVGIGTTTPAYKLSVEGSSSLGNQAIAGYFTATSNTASSLRYASTTALTVSGNSYLGTVSSGTWNGTTIAVANGGTGAATLTGLLQGNGTSAITGITGTAGQFPYYNGASTLLATSTIQLSTASNVGIGAASTGSKLEVTQTLTGSDVANFLMPALSTAGLKVAVLGSNYVRIVPSANTGSFNPLVSAGDSLLNFSTSVIETGNLVIGPWSNSTNGIKILGASGNVGIGVSPTQKLDVAGFINTDQYSGYKQAGNTVLYASTTNGSVAVGASSAATWMSATSSIFSDTAVGQGALATAPTTGTAQYNTAVGNSSLSVNITGTRNTSVGNDSSPSNVSGSYNTTIGFQTLNTNVTGSSNVTVGNNTLYYNKSATSSTAIGFEAAKGTGSYSNQGGVYVGSSAGFSVTTGSDYNTLIGYQSGYGVTTGARNVLLGNSTIATSYNQVTTGSNNISIGNDVAVASATASNQLNIGNLIYGTGLDGTGATLSIGNIGIGITNPIYKLSFATSSSDITRGPIIGFSNSTNNRYTVGIGTSHTTGIGQALIFYAGDSGVNDTPLPGNTERMRITAVGNVGIGTTTPSTKLYVESTGTDTNFLTLYGNRSTSDSEVGIAFRDRKVFSSGIGQLAGRIATIRNGANGWFDLAFSTAPDENTDATEKMRITFAGNIGIGTTTPGQKLSVAGDILGNRIIGSYFTATSTATSTLPKLNVSTGLYVSGFLDLWNTSWSSLSSMVAYFKTQILGSAKQYPAFTYATSTAWTATTTIPLAPAYVGETWNGVKCFTDTGTLNVVFSDGTNKMNLINASTTVGTNTLSTNNAFTASEKRYVDVGTPLSGPTSISCTVSKTMSLE